jgi:ketosteroid isomerase-like protein
MPKNENAVAVRAVFDNWTDAVRRRDIPSILANHAEDIVMFDVPPPFQSKGIKAYAATWDTFYSWTREAIPFRPEEITVTAGDTVAFIVATMHCAEPGPDGDLKALEFRLTVGFEKIAGRWLITHEHHSVPS